MKCKLTQELEVWEPTAPPELIAQCVTRGGKLFAPIGTLIDDVNCYFLVQQCKAEPADEECRVMTNRTAEQLVPKIAWHADGDGFHEVSIPTVEWAALRQSRGIHPDDFEMYESGEILGYTANGDYAPGPNWKAAEVAEDDIDDEEDE